MDKKEVKKLSDSFQANALKRINIIRNEKYTLVGTAIRLFIHDIKAKETEKFLAYELDENVTYFSRDKADLELSKHGINTDTLKKVKKGYEDNDDTDESKALDQEYARYIGIGSVFKANFKLATRLPRALRSIKKLPSIKP